MVRNLLLMTAVSATFSFAQKPQPSVPEARVQLDYDGPYLMKIVNGYGETKPARLPSSICQISKNELLRINASIKYPKDELMGDLEITQSKTLVNAESHGEDLLFQAYFKNLRSISINWKDVLGKIEDVAKLEEKTLEESIDLGDQPTIEYRAVDLGEMVPVGAPVIRQGSKVTTVTPQPRAVTLYSAKDQIKAREGEVVEKLIEGIDKLCDNDLSFKDLKFVQEVSE